jgi:hypothetical protein
VICEDTSHRVLQAISAVIIFCVALGLPIIFAIILLRAARNCKRYIRAQHRTVPRVKLSLLCPCTIRPPRQRGAPRGHGAPRLQGHGRGRTWTPVCKIQHIAKLTRDLAVRRWTPRSG